MKEKEKERCGKVSGLVDVERDVMQDGADRM